MISGIQLQKKLFQLHKILLSPYGKSLVLVVLCYLFVYPFYFAQSSLANPWIFTKRNEVSGQQILEAYDPILNRQLLTQRLQRRCKASLPSKKELTIMKERFPRLSRAVYYYNIHKFLQNYTQNILPNQSLQALGVGGSFLALDMFKDKINITSTLAKHVDIHRTYYPSNKFDIVAADQVIEHVHFPQLAMLEVHRILKPGGIAIITTVAYNPIHGVGSFNDHWRYMPDGLKTLSLPFKGGMLHCGAWGTGNVIGIRARLNTPRDEQEFNQIYDKEVRRNEKHNPFTTWIILQK